jgi:hypothetical protein
MDNVCLKYSDMVNICNMISFATIYLNSLNSHVGRLGKIAKNIFGKYVDQGFSIKRH